MTDLHGHFVWYELMTTDMAAAEAFYARVIGFGARDASAPGMPYTLLTAGEVAIGAPAKAPRGEAAIRPPPPAVHPAALNGHRRFICRGCYFIYEEVRGLPRLKIPAGTGFGEFADTWRCPDCGTEKGNFRPYLGGG